MAKTLATHFESLFGERSLSEAASYPDHWTIDQKVDKLLADSLYALGTEWRGGGDTRDQALSVYLEALFLYRGLGDRLGEAQTLGGLGVVYWYRQEADSVLLYYEEALDVRKAVDDRQLIGNSYNDLGSYYWRFVGDYERALAYYQQAAQVRRDIGDMARLGTTLSYIADVYDDLGDVENALSYYEKALIVHRETGNENREAEALRNAGAVLIDLGRYSDALNYLTRALDIYERLGAYDRTIEVLNWVGAAYRNVGDFESAEQAYQEVRQVAEEANDEIGLADAYNNLGVLLLYADRPQRAAEHFAAAIDRFKMIGDTLRVIHATFNLGSSLTELGEYEDAEIHLLEALELSRARQYSIGEGRTLVLLGNAQLHSSQLDESLANYREALALGQGLSVPDLTFTALMGLGDNYERRGNLDSALEYYYQAFDVLEGTRGQLFTEEDRAGFLAQQRYTFEAVIHLLNMRHRDAPEDGYNHQAFDVAERAKARSFLDLLAEALANVRSGVNSDLFQQQEVLLDNLATLRDRIRDETSRAASDESTISQLRNQLEELSADYDILEREISLQNPAYSALQYPQPITLEDVQQALVDDDTVLLEYAVGDSSTSLWAITSESSELYRLPDRSQLQTKVDLFRLTLTDPNRDNPEEFVRFSRQLYDLLIAPAEEVIQPGKKLIIVPDEILFYLPFETLLTDDITDPAHSFDTFPFLINQHAISYGPSASVLKQLSVDDREIQAATAGRLLAFGDPVFGEEEGAIDTVPDFRGVDETIRAGLSRLPFSGIEVQNIRELFPEHQADVYIRADASEKRIKDLETLTSYQYIHFATHGHINERRPDFSSVVLSRDEAGEEDGFLQAAEIFNLEMDANLVVLSACETGIGKLVRGEGMVSLTRAFMYAGTPSLVVSLWSVSDQSTAVFMEHFYRDLIIHQRDKAEALRRAKLAMIEDEANAHPFYWAPFILTGDWQ